MQMYQQCVPADQARSRLWVGRQTTKGYQSVPLLFVRRCLLVSHLASDFGWKGAGMGMADATVVCPIVDQGLGLRGFFTIA